MIEGLVASESANNAAAQTGFIPTLAIGIPGSATMALILGALMIQGPARAGIDDAKRGYLLGARGEFLDPETSFFSS